MAKPRKKWAVGLSPAFRYYSWSQADIYRRVQNFAVEYAAGMLRFTTATVWVDERDGRGWQCFERVDLADLASQTPPGESR